MQDEETLPLVGVPGSPYSRKLRAVLRYRRIPHAWVVNGSPESRALPAPRVELLPRLVLRDAAGRPEARIDTTPLIRELEARHAGRRVVPPDPVIAFLDALLEDYADEWLTKAMFHYRWAHPADVAKAAAILPRWFDPTAPEERAVAAGESFAKRQIERLWVVGSNETTAATIEESFLRLLQQLDARLGETRFVWGGRPAAADFALYGQLTQLAGFDPTPSALALERAPRVVAWVDLVEDLSGLEPEDADWPDRDAPLPGSVRALFCEVGRVYAPFLLANARAVETGAERVECEIDGRAWRQRPFPYQARCLAELRAGRDALAPADRGALDAILRGTGCESLFG